MTTRDKTARQRYLIDLANELRARWWYDVPRRAAKELLRLSEVEAKLHATELEVQLLKKRLAEESVRTDHWSRKALYFATLVNTQTQQSKTTTAVDTSTPAVTPVTGSVEAQLKVITQRLGRVESILHAYIGPKKPGELP